MSADTGEDEYDSDATAVAREGEGANRGGLRDLGHV